MLKAIPLALVATFAAVGVMLAVSASATSPGLTVKRYAAVVSCDSCGQSVASTPTPTTTTKPTATVTASPTPTMTPIKTPVLSQEAIVAIVNSIPGPAGSGLPNKVTVRLDPTGILPVFITVDLPKDESLFRALSSAAKAAYGKQVLAAIHAAFPALGTGTTFSFTAMTFEVWSVRDWSIYPDFLLGTDYWDCLLNDDFTWFCPYPEFAVKLTLPAGTYSYDIVPWDNASTYRPLP